MTEVHLEWIWNAEHNQNFDPAIEVLPNHRPVGVLVHHYDGNRKCTAVVPFELPESPDAAQKWTVESWSPLTITPLFRCVFCDSLFEIKEGTCRVTA